MGTIKIIDERGKLFGIINAMDFLVILFLFFLTPMFYFGYTFFEIKSKSEKQFSEQIKNLNKIEGNLKNLNDFVNSQRNRLKEAENTLNALKEEEAKLRSLVAADRKIVETIFEMQTERNRKNIWKEQIIIFLSGVLYSFVAMFLYEKYKRLRIRRYERKIPRVSG